MLLKFMRFSFYNRTKNLIFLIYQRRKDEAGFTCADHVFVTILISVGLSDSNIWLYCIVLVFRVVTMKHYEIFFTHSRFLSTVSKLLVPMSSGTNTNGSNLASTVGPLLTFFQFEQGIEERLIYSSAWKKRM